MWADGRRYREVQPVGPQRPGRYGEMWGGTGRWARLHDEDALEGGHRGRQAVRPLRLGPVRGGPLRPLAAVELERLQGDAGGCGEMRGDAGRYGEVWGAAACEVVGSAATSEARAGARSGLAHGGRLAAPAPPPSTREVPESSSHSCSPKRCGLSRWTRCTAYVSRSRLKRERETLPRARRVSS